MQFFQIYQYVAPAVLLPLSYWLWWNRYGDHRLVLLVLSVPILFSYVIPALGTNWLKLWEFNTRWRLGRFRPHHGFLFGSASSMLALACLSSPHEQIGTIEILRSAFVIGCVLAFVNWLYDIHAIKAGFIRVYNRPFNKLRCAEEIATDYAPVFFGAFGLCYGASIRTAEVCLLQLNRFDLYWMLFVGLNVASMGIPVAAYVLYSLAAHGECGLRCYEGVEP